MITQTERKAEIERLTQWLEENEIDHPDYEVNWNQLIMLEDEDEN